MARHRNIRTMNYDEECEGFDDVYGHSVEDDYATSPSMQHFIYDRNQSHQMSAYMANQMQSDIPEEDEMVADDEENIQHITRRDSGNLLRIPPLGELEKAQLYSCLDILRDRMGDVLSEQAAIDAILASNFDVEKALDQLLKQTSAAPESSCNLNRPAILSREAHSVLHIQPTSQDIRSKTSNLGQLAPGLNLGQLATLHLSKTDKKYETPLNKQAAPSNTITLLSRSPLAEPMSKPKLADLAKMNLTKSASTTNNVSFSSLSDLSKIHLQPKAQMTSNFVPSKAVEPSRVNAVGTSLNLSSTLRSNCTVRDDKQKPAFLNSHQKTFSTILLYNDSVLVDPTLMCERASSLGRVMVRHRCTSETVFCYFDRKILSAQYFTSIKRFDFSSPSPDDIIQNRLRMS